MRAGSRSGPYVGAAADGGPVGTGPYILLSGRLSGDPRAWSIGGQKLATDRIWPHGLDLLLAGHSVARRAPRRGARGVCERRARARRADGPELRPGRRLSAAAGVDRGPARGRARADRPLDRVARRLQLPRAPPLRGRGQGRDRGAELRPDDRRAASGQGRDRGRAAERGGPRPRPARVHPGGRACAAR